ncbi:hypothetical protein GW17_00049304 [Ensete ventricosum]|nr:hypothetical protein GW17_00049304 [Ensete ventricosum]
MLRGITIFLKSCPSPPSPSLRRRRRCCPCAGDGCPCPPAATLPRGGHPCGRHLHGRRPCRCYRCWRSPFQVVALAGGASTRRLPSCGCRTRSRPPLVGWPWATVYRPLAAAPAAVAPCGHRAAAGHPRAAAPAVWPRAGAAPLRAGPGRSRSPLYLISRLGPQCDFQFCEAQRNMETTFLRLGFCAGGAGDEGEFDLSQETFFCSGACQGEVSSLHGLPCDRSVIVVMPSFEMRVAL